MKRLATLCLVAVACAAGEKRQTVEKLSGEEIVRLRQAEQKAKAAQRELAQVKAEIRKNHGERSVMWMEFSEHTKVAIFGDYVLKTEYRDDYITGATK